VQRGGSLVTGLTDSVKEPGRSGLLKQALGARERGNLPAAFWLLEEEYRARPEAAQVAEAFWDVAVSYERHQDAVPAVVGLIGKCASAGHEDLAAQYWVELVELEPEALASPPALFRILSTLEQREAEEKDEKKKESLTGALLQALRAIVTEGSEGLSPGIAIHVAELAKDLDAPSALAAAHFALESGDLHDVKRDRLIALIRDLDPDAQTPIAVRESPEPPPFAEKPPEPKPEAPAGPTPEPAPSSQGGPAPLEEHPARHHPLHDPIREQGLEHPPLSAEELAAVRLPPSRPSLPLAEDLGDCAHVGVEIESVNGKLLAIQEDGIFLEIDGGRLTRVVFERVDALTVACIGEASCDHPNLLIDLLLNWSATDGLPLRSVRMRVESLEACIPGQAGESSTMQVRDALAEILDRSRALPLPDPDTALGLSVPYFGSLGDYENELLARRPASTSDDSAGPGEAH